MIEEISRLVKQACERETNYFGKSAWYHISTVVKHAKLLARKMNADEEVCELAALLHDYASVLNKEWYPNHHIHSARLAEEILSRYNYPEEKIQAVTHAILTHRGSKALERETLEAKIVASADAMAHFDEVNSLFYLAFVVHGMGIEKGTKWVLDKLERSWNKLIPEAKEIVREKHKAVRLIFEKRDEK